MTHVVVIGSGPAGVSVAKALLERNCHVTLIDAGKMLEPDRQQLLNRVRNDAPFLHHNKHLFQYDFDVKKNMKLAYGSKFVYETVCDFFHYTTQDCYFQPSFARGGLSHVWGGVISEYTKDVLHDWPLSCQDLSPYYRKITDWLRAFYVKDSSTSLSEQAKHLKTIWLENQHHLEKYITFSAASLAVNLTNCIYCGLCQYGCPHGLIYCSSTHLAELIQHPNFIYQSDSVITHISENTQSVTLTAENIKNHRIEYIIADRVFVACGAGLSSMLYLQSSRPDINTVTLKDSQHFLLPCLMKKKINHIAQYSSYALCQLLLTLHAKHISPYPVYLQLYTYMDLYERAIKKKLKFLYPVLHALFQNMIDRLVIFQGYLHPNDSGKLIIKRNGLKQFHVFAERKSDTQRVFSHIMRLVKKQSCYLDLKLYRFLASCSLVGHSNHLFGSLPMSEHPGMNQSDIFGRPYGWDRVYFVDSSVLPSMPAGPITLTVMANAYRIGKECAL